MFEIGPNLLLAFVILCIAWSVTNIGEHFEEIAREKRYRDERLSRDEIDKQKEITKQVAIAHQHVPRDCSCLTSPS